MLAGFADECVSLPIVLGLRQRGMDVVTAQDRGQTKSDDEILLTMATAEGRLMLTNDHDFFAIHHAWMLSGRNHAGIAYWDQDMPVGVAIRRILHYVSQAPPAHAANFLKVL